MFRWTALDFETTGSVQGYPVEPWQIGIVSLSAEGGLELWESWLHIGERPFHPRAPGRHAQLRRELTEAPTLEACLPELRKRCVGVPLVAHNAATERGVLNAALPLEPFGPWIDTLKLARAAWPERTSHRLEDLVQACELAAELDALLPGRGPHDALYDAAASALLLRHLLAQPAWAGVDLELLLHPDQSGWHRRRF